MNKLNELQYKCASVLLVWNNEQWEITARLPNGAGCFCEGANAAQVIADALLWIDAHMPAKNHEVQK